MSHSISNILRRFVLVPLVVVAAGMVFGSSYLRYLDAKTTLQREQRIALQFLQEPAAEAILLGNRENLEKILGSVATTSDRFICIGIKDIQSDLIASEGRCPIKWPEESTMTIYTTIDTLSDVKSARAEPVQVGELLLIMNSDVFSAEIRRIAIQVVFASLAILMIVLMINATLHKRLVRPIARIVGVVGAVRQKDYSQRIDPFNSSDELGHLAAALNDTIEEIEIYTSQLKTSRDEAKTALTAADDAYLARESLVRSLSHDLIEPTEQMTESLTILAMRNSNAGLEQPIQDILKMAQDMTLSLDDLVVIANTEKNGAATARSSLLLSELLDMLAMAVADISQSLSFDIRYNVSLAFTDESHQHVFVLIDAPRLKRLLYHLCDAIIQQCIAKNIDVETHVTEQTEQHINLSFYFRASYLPGMTSSNAEDKAVQLPSFFDESSRLLIEILCRNLTVAANHMSLKTGAFNLSASITLPFSAEPNHKNLQSDDAEHRHGIIVISNDPEVLKLSNRASLSSDTIQFVRPDQCYHSTPALMGDPDCVAIDIGSGFGDDFDPQRIIDIVNQNAYKKSVIFAAIVDPAVLTDSFIETLLSHGYSGTLQKPLTLTRLRDVLSSLVNTTMQAAQPFEGSSEHD